MISVIIPAYNEERLVRKNTILIRKEMESIKKTLGEAYEIIIVEESSDKTPEICNDLAKKYKEIKHIHSDKRLGKGGAIEKGIESSKGEKIIFMDVDLSTPLEITKNVVEKMNKYDIIVASRYNPLAEVKRSFARSIAGQGFSVLLRLMFNTKMRDTKCGYKAFKKSLAKKIIPHIGNKGWFWDTEFLIYAEKVGCSIYEVPVGWYERKESNVFLMDNIFDMLSNLARLFIKIRLKKYVPRANS